jgi:hypothetical protein
MWKDTLGRALKGNLGDGESEEIFLFESGVTH